MTLQRVQPSRRIAAIALLFATTGGCTIASSTTTGADADLVQIDLGAGLVEVLGLDDIGTGPVTWGRFPTDPAPRSPLTVLDGFTTPTYGIVEVLHRDADTDATSTVVVRPAWTTRMDNRSSDTPMRSSVTDEVTISYTRPGSPGQHGESDQTPTITIDVTVDVAASTCTDVVALQVWQLDDPEVEGATATIDATYLGAEIVSMPCAEDA